MSRSSFARSFSLLTALAFAATPLVALVPGAAADDGPNPSGPSFPVRVFDAGGPNGVPLTGGNFTSNVAYDLTFTNITGTGDMNDARMRNGEGFFHGNGSDAYPDDEHSGKFNVTFPAFAFDHGGNWSLADGVNFTLTTIFVADPGCPGGQHFDGAANGGLGGCVPDGGGGGSPPPPQCFGGNANFALTVHFPGAVGAPAPSVLRSAYMGPGGCVTTGGFNGLAGEDFHGGMGGLQEGTYDISVWLDVDLDGTVDGGEVQDGLTGITLGASHQDLEVTLPGFDAFDPAFIPAGPCYGTGHFNGTVQLTTGSNASVTIQPNSGSCRFGNGYGQGTSHEFENGTRWEFWGLNDALDPWTVSAFLDANNNGQFNEGETIVNETASDGSTIPIVIPGDDLPFQSGGGGGGCPPGGCGPGGGPGGPGGGFGCSASPGGTVHGTVHDPYGNVQGFVNINFQDDATGEGRASIGVNETGEYSCTITPGSYVLNACCNGQAFIPFTIGDGDDLPLDVDLSFNAHPPYHLPTTFYGGTIWGNVTIGNASATGVRVQVYPGFASGPCTEDQSVDGRPLRCYGEGVVQSDGHFVITGLQSATYNLNLDGSGADLPNRYLDNNATFDGATTDDVQVFDIGTITFATPSYIQGVVVVEGGGPVGGVRVSAQPQCFSPPGGSPGPCGSYGEDVTGDDGTYRIAVSAGTYGMEARTDPYFYTGTPLSSARLDCFGGPGSHCIELSEGETSTTNWTLSEGIVIFGHVQDGEGAPVQANINVQQHHEGPCCFGPAQNYWGQTRWDQPGNYSITVEPGTYDVRVEPYSWERPDLASFTMNGVNVSSSTRLDVNLTTGGIIDGNVTDSDGNPASYINIRADTHVDRAPGDCCSQGQFAGYAFTDANGHYRMSGLANGSYDINVQPNWGSEFQQKTVTSVNATPGETTHLDIVLLTGGRIAGFVHGPDGAPVRNAWVNAWWQVDFDPTPPPPPMGGGGGGGSGDHGGGPADDLPECSSTAPADVPLSGTWTQGDHLDTSTLMFIALANGDQQIGTFDQDAHTFEFAGLKACQYVLVAINNGNAGSDEPKPDANGALSFYPDAANDTDATFFHPIDLADPPTDLTMELRDAPEGGWPILQDEGGDGGGSGDGGHGGGFFGGAPKPPQQQEMQSCSTGCWGSAQTDADGHYEIRGLGNGSFGMYVQPPYDHPELSSASLDAFRDTLPLVVLGNTTDVDFTLASAGIVHGCVETASHDPVAYAWLSMWSPTSGGGGGASTGPDGCFTVFGMRAGSYELDVQPPWFGDQAGLARKHVSNIVVVEGDTTELGTIVMSDGITFAGRVVLSSDNAQGVPFASVNVWPISDTPGSFGGSGGFAWTDADGNFTVRGLAEGRFGVNVWPQYGTGLTSFYEEVTLNASVTDALIELGSAGWINGTVVRASNGAPVVGAYVGAWSPHGGYSGAVTDQNGDFNLTNLGPADDYNLDVWPPWDSTDLAGYHAFGLTVESDAGGDIHGNGNNTIALSRGGALAGHVQDADGNPVPNAFINVGGRSTFGWGMTDDDGNFSVPGLSPGTSERLHVFVQPAFGTPLVGKEVQVTWNPDPDSGIMDAGTISLDAGKTLVGTITRGGLPVSAYVYAWPSLDNNGHFSGPPSGGYGTTDGDGNYTIAGVIAGTTYDVSVYPLDGSAGNFTQRAVTIGSGETTTYDAELGGSGDITVHVTDSGTTGDIAGATVDCFNSGLHAGRTGTTDPDGLVTLVGLPVGTYDCHAHAAGHQPSADTATVTASGNTPVEVALDPVTLNTVSGTYATGNSSSAAGYFVIAVPSAGVTDSSTTGFNATTDTGEDGSGEFILDGLVDDDYDVSILDGSGAVVARMSVHIASNAATPALDLTFGDNVDG